jgi:predicted lipoprotein with Yx(FWY)xxD motif
MDGESVVGIKPASELIRENTVHRASVSIVVPILVASLLAACGSSSGTKHASAAPSAYESATTSSTQSAAPAALIVTKQSKLGTILAYGPKRLTVYVFEGDHGGASSCTGACVAAWPPVTGSPQAGAGVQGANLSTITRPEGTSQVTYSGHPLYLFATDKDHGDTYGQGVNAFGASWYVMAPSGKKVDTS